jgi:beta-lactamase superfamily II metal-dependent hydrolase
MAMFKIEMLPAGHGDCLYIEYGAPAAPSRVLIDGGPYYAFEGLARRIDALAEGGVGLELFVVTHVDGDHIDGAVKLVGAQSSAQIAQDVWFNARQHLPERPADMLGPPQGEMLNALIPEDAPWLNGAFGGEAVVVPESGPLPAKSLRGGLQLTLLSPTPRELALLRPVWDAEVRKAGLEPGSREQALEKLRQSARLRPPRDLMGEKRPNVNALLKRPFAPDTSAANGSSIAFLADYEDHGQRTTCLFAADAHSAVLEASISRLLAERGEPKLKVDAVKLSHHGSKANTSPYFLKLLQCKRFLVSTNGNCFGHPDQEAIARVIAESGPEVELFFNYASDETCVWDSAYLRALHNYRTHYPPPGAEGLSIEL